MRGPLKPLPRERGAIVKKWRDKIPVCIVYPNAYYIGMSNLAVHILYRMLNAIPDVVCERCFFGEDGKVLSMESGRPLSAFEVVFITVSFELDYINIPRILNRASIPLFAQERGEGVPVIAAGGICLMANPEPLHLFIDLFLLGDIEAIITDFMDTYRRLRGCPRDEVINGLSTFDFAYNPEKLSVSYREDGVIDSFTPPQFSVNIKRYKGKTLGSSAVISDGTEFSNMFLIEGTRGCPSRCPFCLLGNSYAFVHDDITSLDTDEEHIGLIGGGVSFHPHLVELLTGLKVKGKTPHLPSLRIDEVPLSVIELMKDDIKTLTFGVEAGTERLRRFIGKPLSDRAILETIEAILAIKPFNLKLYFMVGLYGETMEDIDAIVDLVKHLKHIMLKKGAKRGVLGTITVHASPFVPKPSTPFQWLPMEETASLKNKLTRLKKAFGKVDNTFFTHESIKYSLLQGILAMGDRRITEAILRLSSGENLTKVMRESPVNLNFYILREKAGDELLPWDFIKGRTGKEKLYRRLESALGV
ncbi:MAG: hypothetical protein C0392_00890 [Syntrophus sp. (in: bacteria)]|nr:hypothetical protein [Syntrophus sp. (in: bacteria)]